MESSLDMASAGVSKLGVLLSSYLIRRTQFIVGQRRITSRQTHKTVVYMGERPSGCKMYDKEAEVITIPRLEYRELA